MILYLSFFTHLLACSLARSLYTCKRAHRKRNKWWNKREQALNLFCTVFLLLLSPSLLACNCLRWYGIYKASENSLIHENNMKLLSFWWIKYPFIVLKIPNHRGTRKWEGERRECQAKNKEKGMDGGGKGENHVARCFFQTTKPRTKYYKINLLHLSSIQYWIKNKYETKKNIKKKRQQQQQQQGWNSSNTKKCCGLPGSQRNHKTNTTICKDVHVWSDA